MKEQKAVSFDQQINTVQDLLQRGKKDQALELLDILIRECNKDNYKDIENLGVLCLSIDDGTRAIPLFSHLVAENPGNVQYLDELAASYIKVHRTSEAELLLNKVLNLQSDYVPSLINLAVILMHKQQHHGAMLLLEKAQIKEPQNPSLLLNLSIAYNHVRKPRQALDCINKAPIIPERAAYIYFQKGRLAQQLNQTDDAIKHYKNAISINKHFGACYWGIGTAKKYTKDDKSILKKLYELLDDSMSSEDRVLICFTIAKINDDLGNWDEAFKFYKLGNTIKKGAEIHPPPKKLFKQLSKHCKPLLKNELNHRKDEKRVPFFIFGMPRTGSTLTEQILCTHKDVSSAGEISELAFIGDHVFGAGNKSSKEVHSLLTQDNLDTYASDYLDFLKQNTGSDAIHIINKSPSSYIYLGFILTLFPNAKLIHTTRHPLDTLLSCYFQPFDSLSWTQDFESLAMSYRFYDSCMKYWQSILPPDRILNFSYEELISDPDTQSRRLMEYCELDWTPDCLTFFKQKGSISTSSLWQVRQPLYKTSSMRWVNYAKYIEKLAEQVQPFLTEEDINILGEHGIRLSAKKSLKQKLLGF